LVYYETLRHPMQAIRREKQIKRLSRKQKIELIESDNPCWGDLARDWFDPPPTGHATQTVDPPPASRAEDDYSPS
jgi:hypothetical protein